MLVLTHGVIVFIIQLQIKTDWLILKMLWMVICWQGLYITITVLLCCVVLCCLCVVLCCVVLCCVVLCCVVLCCVVLCCVVLCCVVLCCVVLCVCVCVLCVCVCVCVGGEAVILKVLVGITQCTTSLNGIGVLANPHLRGLSYNSHNTTQHTTQTTQ